MFGLGFWELVVIAVVALLFVGPERLPKFFQALGRATREFQRASRELRENLSLDEPAPPPRPPAPRPPRPRPVPDGAPLRAPPDAWPEASPIRAESKPSEPFDELRGAGPGAPDPQQALPYTDDPDAHPAPPPVESRPAPHGGPSGPREGPPLPPGAMPPPPAERLVPTPTTASPAGPTTTPTTKQDEGR